MRMKAEEVKEMPELRSNCPHCGSSKTTSHQCNPYRRIVDWGKKEVCQMRMKCKSCGRTYTVNPEGITKWKHRSNRVIGFGILLYALGLSYGGVVKVIEYLTGRRLSRSTILKDVTDAGERVRRMRERYGERARIGGIDGTLQKMKGWKRSLIVVIDAETGLLLEVGLIDEEEEKEVRGFIKELERKYGFEACITDCHRNYEGAFKSAEHWRCKGHIKKNMKRRAREIREEAKKRGWVRYLKDVERLVELVDEGGEEEEAVELHKKYLKKKYPVKRKKWSLGYKMRMLTLDLLKYWRDLRREEFETNNITERCIGEYLKVRSVTMRGFAVEENVVRFMHLRALLVGGKGELEVKELIGGVGG